MPTTRDVAAHERHAFFSSLYAIGPFCSVLLPGPPPITHSTYIISSVTVIGKTGEVAELVSEEATVVQWFSHHHFPLAKLREIVKSKLGKAKELVKAGATRFGTHTLVGQRLLELKSSLQATVVDDEYVAQNYTDKGNTEEEAAVGRIVRSNKGATTKKLVLDDSGA